MRRCRLSRLHFPGARPRHPGAVRMAEPGAGSLPERVGPGRARRRASGWELAGPELHPASPGTAMEGDNEI